MKTKKLLALQKALGITTSNNGDGGDGKRMAVVVIDEISLVKPTLLACIDLRLQEATGLNEPFGGIPVVMLGDFCQLPPIKATSLTDAAVQLNLHDETKRRELHNEKIMSSFLSSSSAKKQSTTTTTSSSSTSSSATANPKAAAKANAEAAKAARAAAKKHLLPVCKKGAYKRQTKVDKMSKRQAAKRYAVNSLYRRGTTAFAKSRFLILSEQIRSGGDKRHTKFVRRLSKGKRIRLRDLKRGYKRLSAKDFRKNGHKWRFAPILVGTNRERFDLTEVQAIEFAKQNNTHVIRWPVMVNNKTWINKPANTTHVRENDPLFYQFWVPDAVSFGTHNVSQESHVCNGTKLESHSLTFANEQQRQFVAEQRATLPAGSVITLKEPPLSANFRLFPDKPLDERLALWEEHVQGPSLVQNDTIFPLPADTANSNHYRHRDFSDHLLVRGKAGSDAYFPSKVQTKLPIPFELGFSITIYKAQGRTLDNVILSISKAQKRLTFPSIFVAFSRVKCADDIRLLLVDRGGSYDSLEYLTELKPPEHFEKFFSHLDETTGKWDAKEAYESFLPSHS